MARTEWREAGKELGYFLIVLVVLALLTWAGRALGGGPQPFADRYLPLVQVALLGFALLSGIAPFAAETRQGGMEYLLSLPLPRSRLLWLKFAPRLTMVLGLLIAFGIANASFGDSHWPIVPGFFAFFLPGVFLISFSVSLCSERFVALAFIAMAAILLYLGLVTVSYWAFWLSHYRVYLSIPQGALRSPLQHTPLSGNEMTAPFPLIVLLLPFPLAFGLAFRRFDQHPRRRHVRRLLTVLLPGLLVALLLSGGWLYLQNRDVYSSYCLTRDQQVLKSDMSGRLSLYGPQGKRRVLGGEGPLLFLIPLLETEGKLYGRGTIGRAGRSAETVEEIDLASARRKTLHVFPDRDLRLSAWIEKKGRELLWLETDRPYSPKAGNRSAPPVPGRTLLLARLDRDRGTISRVPVSGVDLTEIRPHYTPLLGHEKIAGKDWLILATPRADGSCRLLLVDGEGHWREPGGIAGRAFRARYFRHRLFLYGGQEGLRTYRLTEAGWESEREFSGSFAFLFRPSSHDWDRELPGDLYVSEKGLLARLDERLGRLVPIPLPAGVDLNRSPLQVSSQGVFILHDPLPGKLEVYEVKDDRVELRRCLDIRPPRADLELRNLGLNGFLVEGTDSKVHAYAFPDLRELKYPGLK